MQMRGKKGKDRIVILDLLRLVALSVVVFTHIAQKQHSILGSFFGIPNFYWVSFGGLAVTIFIILSGFVLELNYGEKNYSYFHFLLKRIKYIYPIYWFSLVFGALFFLLQNDFKSLLTNLTNPLNLFHFLSGTYAFSGQWSGPFLGTSWFIGLIVVLYSIFPLLSWTAKKNRYILFIACLLISLISRVLIGQLEILPNRALDWFPLSRIFEFYLGMYIATNKSVITLLQTISKKITFKYIYFLAELSFPAFLVHFPLLIYLNTFIRKLGSIGGISFYLLLTAIISLIVDTLIKIFITKNYKINFSMVKFKKILMKTKKILLKIILDTYYDQLHRNSFFLIASTGVMATIGFLFWIIASRFYSPAAIGIGGSLISLTNLIQGIASLGLPITLIRFLPNSKTPNQKISTAIVLTGIVALVVSIIFFFVTRVWLIEIFALINSPQSWSIFMLCVVLGTWQQIENSIVIAYKRAKWVFVESITFSSLKILLVLPFAYLQGFGIFIGQAGSLALATLISLFVHVQKYQVNFFAGITQSIVKQLWKYSALSYLIGLTNGIPAQILPAIMASTLGPEPAAHFFLALMMVNLVTIVPQASSQTLFAAASADPSTMRSLTIKSLKMQIIVISLALLGLWVFGGLILFLFGRSYSQEITPILRILSLSVIPIVIATPLNTRLRVRKELKKLAAITVTGSIAIIFFCYLGVRYGLQGVSYGYVAGQVFYCLLILFEWKSKAFHLGSIFRL